MAYVRLPAVFCAVVMFAGTASAQRLSAAIDGVVVDEAGAPLEGVTVSAKNLATGLQRGARSDANGRFVLVSLPVEGDYEILALHPGFATLVREHVTLSADETLVLNFTLRLAAEQSVVVSAPEPVLDRSSTVRQSIGEPLVRSLPLFGRSFLPLSSLAAGFTGNMDFPNPQGQAYSANNVLVDGSSHFSKWRSTARSFHSGYALESIKQVEVMTNHFSAEFGEALASVTSVTTKAGTNQLHGSAQLFARDDAFDAVPVFATRKAPSSGQQIVLSVGGPLAVDRTHVFGAYEAHRMRDHNVVVSPAAFDAVVPDEQDEHLLFLRLDHQVGTHQLITAHYNGEIFRWHHEGGGLELPGVGTGYQTDAHTVLVSDGVQASERTLHELRVQWARFVDQRNDLQPTVFVSRAGYSLAGGALGATPFGTNPETAWEAGDTVSYWVGPHALRFGGRVRSVNAAATSEVYGRGAYFFAGPPSIAPQPYLFIQTIGTSGQPDVVEPRSLAGGVFVQDDWRVHPRATVNFGVRYDLERVSNVRGYDVEVDANNLQPRVGVAWQPGSSDRLIVRGGAGVYVQQHLFYPISRVALQGPQGAATLTLTPESSLFPSFPAVLPGWPAAIPAVPRDIYQVVGPVFRNPYAIQEAIGMERRMFGGQLAVDAVHLHGFDLISLIDANAPASLADPQTRTVAEADATRPVDPAVSGYRALITTGNEGRSWYRALQVKFDRSTTRFQGTVAYTWSSATDMANYELPEDSRNLAAEKGRAATDIRHNLSAGATWIIPGSEPLTRGWSISGLGFFRGNRPYTITWGDDRNGTTQNDARPGGRNTGRTGPYRTVDAALSRRFTGGRATIDARLEAFNLFNATNYDQYVGTLLSPQFAQPISAFPQRRLQFAVIVRF